MSSNWADEVNGGHDDEAALRRAIAMSLGHDISDEPTMSGPSQSSASAGSSTANKAESNQPPQPSQQPQFNAKSGTAFDMAALDRKKMEQERLARLTKTQGKRKAEEALVDTSSKSAQRPKVADDAGVAQPSLRQQAPSLNSNVQAAQQDPGAARLQYPKGIVLKTWVRDVPRGNDIKIEEVFRKDELELAILSSFQWDEDWLVSKLNLSSTRVLLIAFANNDAQVCDRQDVSHFFF